MDKCELMQFSIKYLGFLITKQGIRNDDKGIAAITNFPVSKKVHNVQSYLGLCSFILQGL